MSLRARIDETVFAGVTRLDARLRVRALEGVAARLEVALEGVPEGPATMLVALTNLAEASAGAIERIEAERARIMVEHQAAATEEGKRAVLVRFLESRQARSRARLRGDIEATRRWLDLEAVQERITIEIADELDRLDLLYQLMGAMVEAGTASVALSDSGTGAAALAAAHAGANNKPPLRTAALRFLGRAAATVPVDARLQLVGVALARRVQSYALGEGATTTRWTQVAAIELSSRLFPGEAHLLAAKLLSRRGDKDGMIIRRNALRVLASVATRDVLVTALLARDDPSEHVRQELARVLRRLRTEDSLAALAQMATTDPADRVAGVALNELVAAASELTVARAVVADALRAALAAPKRPLCTRLALEGIRALSTGRVPALGRGLFVRDLERLANNGGQAAADLTEGAARLLRWLEVESSAELRALCELLAAALEPLLEGGTARLTLPDGPAPVDVERALAVAATGDMTVSLRRERGGRVAITRGEPRRFRFWRFLHELRTPMPDKRKGYVHTAGRVWAGETVIAPSGMAEVTPTRVPGERQLYAALGGWAPFVPRVDDLLAVATLAGRPLRIVSPSGTLIIEPPEMFVARMRARLRIAVRYAEYAAARERSLTSVEPVERRAYAASVASMGFRVRLAETTGTAGGEAFDIRAERPARFIAKASLALPPPGTVEALIAYVFAPAGGTPLQLGIVAWIVLAWLVVRAAAIMRGIERSRALVPLTIGGWGTRGKSGSERLKAALFHALRYDVVVKTTGCEAMFIHAVRDSPAQEIFIYRPYDKATIWEQRNVLHVAQQLGAQVFLWECMALQPRFVDTLANEWMRDAVTTLTNAYPDHEDIQGPGGEDVARVIGRFMPVRGETFTTEDQMLPLLADAARRKETRLQVVSPMEADLLPIDLLDRLPYQEHPRNVAMVLALAEHFGVDRELALVEIGDYVVADLGVLKTYPTVEHRGRRLTFSNGMSANERAGFMSNWTRLAFDRNDVDAEPDVAICAVVNNRGDRVARSRVFAQIFVDDAACDHVVLINTNLGGLVQFIEEALAAKLAGARVTGEGGLVRALERFDDAMRWLKVPSGEGPRVMHERVGRMLRALPLGEEGANAVLGNPAVAGAMRELSDAIAPALESALASVAPEGAEDRRPDVVRHAVRLAGRLRARIAARAEVAAAVERGADDEANAVFRRVYRVLFMDRIAVLWDAGATGDQVIDFAAREVAPGQNVRLMGTQNIKGTGLDFVYRWLSVDRVRANLERLTEQPHLRSDLLAFFGSYTDFGLVDCREALSVLRGIASPPRDDWSAHRALLESVITRLETLEKEKTQRLQSSGKAGPAVRALGHVEAFVDHLDSVRRTRRAAQVMNDLFELRVGHGRAAVLLRDITGRGKGGWLAKDLASAWARVRALVRRREITDR